MKLKYPRTLNQQQADYLHLHAKRCEKRLGECRICQHTMEFFNFQSLPVLGEMLEDVPATQMMHTVLAGVLDRYLDRTTHKSKRASSDCQVTAQFLTTASANDNDIKRYVERGIELPSH